jgi:cell division protein FtsA
VRGLVELAEEIFEMPVRMGNPQYVTGLNEVIKNPIHATGVGLLIYGKEHQHNEQQLETDNQSWFVKIRNWFQGNF